MHNKMLRVARRLPLVVVLTLLGAAYGTASENAEKRVDSNCDRACLRQVLDQYFHSLSAHAPTQLPTSSGLRVTENAVDVPFGGGLWTRAGSEPARNRLDAFDPVGGQAASSATIVDGGKNSILFVRLKVENRKVSEIETHIVRPGEGQRADPEGLKQVSADYKHIEPAAQRSSRAQLIAAVNAYFDGLGTAGTEQYRSPPFAPNTIRMENGLGAGGVHGASIDEELRKGFHGDKLAVSERRFPVIDEEHGVIVAIGRMNVKISGQRPPPPPGQPAGHARLTGNDLNQVLVEFFKVSDGKIQQIQATMLDLNDPKVSSPGWPVQ